MYREERVNYKADFLRLMALFAVVVRGSSLSLRLGTITAKALCFWLVGFAMATALALAIGKQHRPIEWSG